MQLKKVKHILIILLLFDAITIFISAVFKQKTILTKAFSSKGKINAKNTAETAKFYVVKLNNANNNFRFGEISKVERHSFALTEERSYLINNKNTSKALYAPAPVTMLPHHSFW
ncbi:hypothetical protein [Mucilaginibacter sp.]|jgi:hypothetical protein|uniref:hypothetical protein n=1 Tax=Mucilaginibacter sp. TaxID=1882438 RepID=UPI003561EF4B